MYTYSKLNILISGAKCSTMIRSKPISVSLVITIDYSLLFLFPRIKKRICFPALKPQSNGKVCKALRALSALHKLGGLLEIQRSSSQTFAFKYKIFGSVTTLQRSGRILR